jgi:hypothetical protein
MRHGYLIVIWSLVVALLAAIGSRLYHLGFWQASAVAACTLIVNGLIAEWEDR